ncbi:hypothetical protein CONPUDRAFT_158920 [Coniophora puteana RWD-64-598 SS2]|uniref:Uncharacterized protein n=1 Tax=Coniophora puteana (strain RWD-64-598) TaxID=741705 RepID=A0A5M3M895_CONPW|nr:uncharacterized protein CONPUDRAFT_158920 [Coniophora puteana RWD-64-598 SS2]EIW75458.1 hypothetical protein CONPUDRAFT_158920 [Coniophora puteana RWD-64-598 SS2]
MATSVSSSAPLAELLLTTKVKKFLEVWQAEWNMLAESDYLVRCKNLDDLAWKLQRHLIAMFPYLQGGLTDVEDTIVVVWKYFDPNGKLLERPCPEDGTDARWLGHLSRTHSRMWAAMSKDEKAKYKKVAEDWNRNSAPRQIQKYASQKWFSEYMRRHKLFCLRQFGAETVTWAGWVNNEGVCRVAHCGQAYGGDPHSFHRRDLMAFDTDRKRCRKGEVPWPKRFVWHVEQCFLGEDPNEEMPPI